MTPPSPDIRDALAPGGRLRASINLGNPILANRGADGRPFGVSIDLAHALGERLDAEVELVVFDTAGRSVEAVAADAADVGFFAIDPVRGADIAFTAPYVLIEGAYLVPAASPIERIEQVDGDGVRVVVGRGSAYDLYLTRELRRATIHRAPSSPAVVDEFVATGAEVAAGVRQQLEADTRRHAGLRLLPGRFMVIRQAMGLPKRRGPEAAGWLHEFVESMKAEGRVAESLARHRIEGAGVAPPAGSD